MGEIKSTLDLVMEKTRHLTLSDEEKADQQRMEANKKIYGLVRRYQDKLIAKTYIEKEMGIFRKTYDVNVDEILLQTLLDGIKLGDKNDAILQLLRDICDVDISPFEGVLQGFLQQVGDAARSRMKTIKGDLVKKRSISGSAVVPNLEADDEWLSVLDKIRIKFDADMNKEKAAAKVSSKQKML